MKCEGLRRKCEAVRRWLAEILCCPWCKAELTLAGAEESGGAVESGRLECSACDRPYPITGGVPRFVLGESYAASFGFQWNRFAKTQLDSHSGLPISRERFFRQTGWGGAELGGKMVLDVGCGAGRFAEVALSADADVVATDCSAAVDACRRNLGGNERLDVVQGDIYHLPFRPGSFDFIYCFGVLQHTPDVAGAFRALIAPLRPGGRLAVDVYPKLLRNVLWSKYWLRPFTRRMDQARLFVLAEWMVRRLLPVSRWLGRMPLAGRYLRYAIPVVNYEGVHPLSESQLLEWSLLDTFDMLSPVYDRPQTAATLRKWFQAGGFEQIEVFRNGVLVGRGRKVDAPPPGACKHGSAQ